MPELPEVEQVRASIARCVVGLRVASVTVHRRDVVVGPDDPQGGWSRAGGGASKRSKPRIPKRLLLEGSEIHDVRRHGKQLGILSERAAVGVHLGMTGQLLFCPAGQRLVKPDHVHLVWRLTDQSGDAAGRMVFRDPRRFGGVWAHADRRCLLEERWAALGPDALAIEAGELGERLRPKRVRAERARSVKAALLDQNTLAGVGNIYADEALFRAGVLPMRGVDSLTGQEIERLAEAIREVLTEAVAAGGSTLRDYVDGQGAAGWFQVQHRVYGRAGQLCVRCGKPILSGTIAQRTTVWCGCCQR
jgi:formamidopyrimidine-DNA glycosylase